MANITEENIISISSSAEKASVSQDKRAETDNHALEAEALLLGIILRNHDMMEHCEGLESDHFYSKANSYIFKNLQRHFFDGRGYDVETLKYSLAKNEHVSEAGGSEYIIGLLKASGSSDAVRHYSKLVRDAYIRRSLTMVCEETILEATDLDISENIEDLLEKTEQKLFTIAEKGVERRNIVDFATASAMSLKDIAEARSKKGTTGVTTGFKRLDAELAGGLHRSDLIIVAGRPGMGKTAFATNLAVNAADAWREAEDKGSTEPGAHVLYFSLEMSVEQLSGRILSSSANVEGSKLRAGKITREEFNRINEAADKMSKLPLFIDDNANHSVSNILQRGRRFKRRNRGRLGLIIIDYLQLLAPPIESRSANKVQQITDITRMLKIIAKELDAPVIALSQLSRELERRGNQPGAGFGNYRPQLADLRESGSIEQDADIVMFLHREEYYLERNKMSLRENENEEAYEKREAAHHARLEESRNCADLDIAKHRHGGTGRIEFKFDKMLTSFEEKISPT